MRSLRARAILRSHGYIKRANREYVKVRDCHWCEGFDLSGCWLCEGTGKSSEKITVDHFKEVVTYNGYHTEVSPCQGCGTPIREEYCCNGYLCGCMGLPIEPPLCRKCMEKERLR